MKRGSIYLILILAFLIVIPLATSFNFPTDKIKHNKLSGLQGGSSEEYYHFNETIYDYILANYSNLTADFSETDPLWTSNYSAYNDSWSADDDTTYTNGTGLSLVGNVFSIVLSYFQGLFIEQSNEGDLNVNSSLYSNETTWWADLIGWDSDWFENVGNNLSLNELKFNDSVKNLFAEEQVIYNATSISTTTGTLDSGDLNSITQLADGDTYNVSEVTGAPGFLIYINFTNVTNFNTIALRGMYDGGAGHTIALEIFRVGVGWEERAEITDQTDWGVTTFPVFIGSDFIDGGIVQFRINHDDNGISNHNYFLDAVFIGQVPGLVTGGDLDDLTGRDEACLLLPDVFCKDGSKNMTGNLNMPGYNLTASWFKGIFNWIIGSTSTNYLSFNGTHLDFNETFLNATIEDKSVSAVATADDYLRNDGDTATGTIYFDALPLGLDVLYTAEIGTHLTVGDDLTAGNGTLFVDKSTGRVGMGTTSPVRDLHLMSTNPRIRLSDSDAGTEQAVYGIFEWYQGLNTNRVGWFGFGSSNNKLISFANEVQGGGIQFLTNNTNRITINDNGNIAFDVDTMNIKASTSMVGINKGNPTHTLDINGNFRMDGQADFTENVDVVDTLSAGFLQASTDSRVRATRITSTQAVTGTTIVIWNSGDFDTFFEYNTATGRFTATIEGYYFVNSHVYYTNGAWAVGENRQLSLYKNNALYSSLFLGKKETATSVALSMQGTGLVYLDVGDYIDIRVSDNIATSVSIGLGFAPYNYLEIHRLS